LLRQLPATCRKCFGQIHDSAHACAQRCPLAGIILIGIAFLIGIPFLGGKHLRVGGGHHRVQRGGAARFFKNALLAISYINKSRSFRTDMLR